ncbi:MAG TPA: hypothetical protein PLA50_09055 [Bacteroidia bacterium]|nr:hypothetical protein [Bacteroidia bacterium]
MNINQICFSYADSEGQAHEVTVMIPPIASVCEGQILFLARKGKRSFLYKNGDWEMEARVEMKNWAIGNWVLYMNGIKILPDTSRPFKNVTLASLADIPIGPDNELLSPTALARGLRRLGRPIPFATTVPPGPTIFCLIIALVVGAASGTIIMFIRTILYEVNGVNSDLTFTGITLSLFVGMWVATKVFASLRKHFIRAAD